MSSSAFRVKVVLDLPEENFSDPVWEISGPPLAEAEAIARVRRIYSEMREEGFYFDSSQRRYIPEFGVRFVQIVQVP